MKLLFDENLSFKLAERLSDLFPGSSQVRLIGLSRADDRTVWNYARTHDFMLVSGCRFRRNGRVARAAAKGHLAAQR